MSSSPKQIYIRNNQVSIGEHNRVRAGGEGTVYKLHDNLGVKIFHDPSRVTPKKKIQELGGIRNPNIITPQDLAYGSPSARKHLGHTFRFISDTWVLCQVFARSFRDREGILPEHIHAWILKLKEGIEDLHRASVLGVDLNEMNFLVPQSRSPDVFFIDVDSYQTPSYPATAIMTSIRDPHASKWSEGTDWFSFAVLVFQLFVGIHPYRGKHPSGVATLEDRMKQGHTVYDPGVTLPPPCYPIADIPQAYGDWLRSVFVDGKRSEPPASLAAKAPLPTPHTFKDLSGKLEVTPWVTCQEPVLDLLWIQNAHQHVLLGASHIWVDHQKFMATPRNGSRPVVHVDPVTNLRYLVWADRKTGLLDGVCIETKDRIVSSVQVVDVMACDGCAYARNEGRLFELSFTKLTSGVHCTLKDLGEILPKATQFYPGCIVQDMMGTPLVCVFPGPGKQQKFMLPDLKDHYVLSAKYSHGVLGIVTLDTHNIYTRYIYRVDPKTGSLECRTTMISTPEVVNFTVIASSSTVVLRLEDGSLQLFKTYQESKSVGHFEDLAMQTRHVQLMSDGSHLLALEGPRIEWWKMR